MVPALDDEVDDVFWLFFCDGLPKGVFDPRVALDA